MTANKKTQLFEPRHLSKTTFPLLRVQTSYGNPLSFRVYRTSPLRPYLSVDTNATQYPKTKKIERGAGGSTVPLSYLMWAALGRSLTRPFRQHAGPNLHSYSECGHNGLFFIP